MGENKRVKLITTEKRTLVIWNFHYAVIISSGSKERLTDSLRTRWSNQRGHYRPQKIRKLAMQMQITEIIKFGGHNLQQSNKIFSSEFFQITLYLRNNSTISIIPVHQKGSSNECGGQGLIYLSPVMFKFFYFSSNLKRKLKAAPPWRPRLIQLDHRPQQKKENILNSQTPGRGSSPKIHQ